VKYLVNIYLLFSLWSSSIKSKATIYNLKISHNNDLVFLNDNEEFKLYSKPWLIKNGHAVKIEGMTIRTKQV